MKMNTSFHTPEEIREIMRRLIGKKVGKSFRVFRHFIQIFGKTSRLVRMSLSTLNLIFKTKGVLLLGMMYSFGTT